MSINPIGSLKQIGDFKKNEYKLERGVYSFPSVGDSVVVPTQEQLKAIVENNDENANIYIGNATIAGNAKVFVDPDKLFGRHLAVLGNTGSGKSCTVAGLIRWSIESAKEKIVELNRTSEKKDHKLNSRFIILDPNGEYANTFNDLNESVTRFRININEDVRSTFKDLQIPAWLWNSNEWISIAQAAPGTQRPLLMQALAGMKTGSRLEDPWTVRLK
ncbi:MAG: DUF87 domain-containing protein [Bacteroidetes bacterium]|nr:DUF87 domain-containing protein [Bacteroidota bacterium]